MTLFREKFRLIYRPFLIATISCVLLYSFLNWLLVVQLRLFPVKEKIVNLFIPMIIPAIPIFFRIRPRLKLLNLKAKKGSWIDFYTMVIWLAMAAPTLVAQSYLQTATGALSRLDNITEIKKQPRSKYYTLKNAFIDKQHISVKNILDVSGKDNEYLNMGLFVVVPILSTPADTSETRCLAWYGVKYLEQISNRLQSSEKQARFRRFIIESHADFDKKDLTQYVYFDRIGYSEDHDSYNKAIKDNNRFSGTSAIVLIPVNEPFESRNGNKLAWIFGAFGIGSLLFLLLLINPEFDQAAFENYNSGVVVKETSSKEILSLFLPKEGYYITPIILDINIFIYIIMVCSGLGFLSFKASDLLAWGANFRPVTTNGEWWRLVTSTFLHGGLVHLVANMCGLLFVGIFLESKLGKVKYAVIYISTGIIASLASLYLHNPTVSIGASGAIFGLYGVFLAFLLTKVFPKEFGKAFLTTTLIFIGYNLLMGFAGTGVDNAAHVGGLVSGFIIGLILSSQLKRQQEDEQVFEGVERQMEV